MELALATTIRPNTLEPKSIQVDNRQVHYFESPILQQEPIVFLHGWGLHAKAYWAALKLLGEKYRVIAVDLPGFGRSTSLTGALTYDRYAQAIERFLDAIDVKRAHFIGHSFGGGVSAAVAAHYPSRAKSVVLLDSTGIPLLSFKDLFWQRLGEVSVETVKDRFRLGHAAWMISFFRNLAMQPRSMVRSFEVPTRQDIRSLYSKIQAPTLLIWGGRDRLVPFQHGIQLSRLVPNADLITIEDGYHEWPMIFPERLFDIATKFYQKQGL